MNVLAAWVIMAILLVFGTLNLIASQVEKGTRARAWYLVIGVWSVVLGVSFMYTLIPIHLVK